MKKTHFSLTIFVILIIISCRNNNMIKDGEYIGFEPISYTSDRGEKWYHENILSINNGEILLKKSPIGIKEKQKAYSASTGGFYTYQGKISANNKKTTAILKCIDHDYTCTDKIILDKAKEYPGYEKWPTEKQIKMGILVTQEIKPIESELKRNKDLLIFDGVVYKEIQKRENRYNILPDNIK